MRKINNVGVGTREGERCIGRAGGGENGREGERADEHEEEGERN